MPLTTYDLPTLQAQIMANFRAQFASANPPKDLSPTGYFGQLANVLAMTLLEAQNALLQVDQDWPPCGATYTPGRQSSSAALDQAAFLLGLPNGQGGFGRLLPTISSGGTGTLFAPAGTTYSNGLNLVYQPTQVQVQLSGAVTIPAMQSSAVGVFVSVTTGTAANLPANAVLTFQVPPPGAQSTVTLLSALTGGTDLETDGALLARIFDRLQNPPTGGKSVDWKDWLASVPAVKQVFVFPKRSGTGTVDVMITTDSPDDPGRIPSTQTQADALAALNANRPVCSQPNILVPYFPAGRALYIWSLAYPTLDKYAWDWVSGSMQAGRVIAAYTPGASPVLQINGDIRTGAPTLAAAITGNKKPRIIVASTGGPTVCLQVPVKNDGSALGFAVVAGPKTNLTLDTLPAGWVDPTVGDLIFPGGPIAYNQLDPTAGPIQKSAAQRVFEYIGQLGPSRQSGYADPAYYWDDTARIDAIKDVIINTVDLDGVQMIRSTGDETLMPPVTSIQIGTGGTPTAQNFQALDATPGQPPEVIRAFRIVVTGV
jgi:hypothetical protein